MQLATRKHKTLWLSSLVQLVCANFGPFFLCRNNPFAPSSKSFIQVVRSFKRAICSFEQVFRSFKQAVCSFKEAVHSFKRAVHSFIQAVWSFTSPVSNGLSIRSKIFMSRSPILTSRLEYLISRSVVHLGRSNGLSTRFLPDRYPCVSPVSRIPVSVHFPVEGHKWRKLTGPVTFIETFYL